jgi:hypothetical protein
VPDPVQIDTTLNRQNRIQNHAVKGRRPLLNRIAVTECGINISMLSAIGAEKPIPEEIDHREIAVPMAVVDEMELLLLSEPGKAAKP